MSASFTVVKLYSDEQGETHFGEINFPLTSAGDIGSLSEKIAVAGVILREVEPSYDYDFHTAPQKQFIVLLEGEIEIETSLGDKRTFRAGDIILLEDTTGKGHKTKNTIPEKRRSLFITFE